MIERQILAQKLKEKEIENFVFNFLGKLSCSHVKMQRTPLGEKIVVYTSRPGMIVGKKGSNIRLITSLLKQKFGMENPQIEVEEITNPAIDAASVTRSLISGFQRFGPKRFKAMAYKVLEDALKMGASGIEVVISGRGVPGERAKTWRFSAGYLKKSGDISANFMDRCYEGCDIKSGTIGIKVSILHSDVVLPDKIHFKTQQVQDKAVEDAHKIKADETAEQKTEGKTEKKTRKPKKTEKQENSNSISEQKSEEGKTEDKTEGKTEKKPRKKSAKKNDENAGKSQSDSRQVQQAELKEEKKSEAAKVVVQTEEKETRKEESTEKKN